MKNNFYKLECYVFLKYHWTCFFFQWLRLRIKMFWYGMKAVYWSYVNDLHINLRQRLNVLKWNTWKRYKKHGTYLYKRDNVIWMIGGDELNETIIVAMKRNYIK